MPTKINKPKTEEFKINGEDLLKKVKELIHQGNIRKITINSKSGQEVLSFSLTFGVVGAAILPPLAVVGTIAALLTECTVTIERES
ncbi:MAG: DUF4342 domain-containing protein [Candidatus Shapirobacteria bacterium]